MGLLLSILFKSITFFKLVTRDLSSNATFRELLDGGFEIVEGAVKSSNRPCTCEPRAGRLNHDEQGFVPPPPFDLLRAFILLPYIQ